LLSPILTSAPIFGKEQVKVFKAMGGRWQTQMNAVLKSWVEDHPAI